MTNGIQRQQVVNAMDTIPRQQSWDLFIPKGLDDCPDCRSILKLQNVISTHRNGLEMENQTLASLLEAWDVVFVDRGNMCAHWMEVVRARVSTAFFLRSGCASHASES